MLRNWRNNDINEFMLNKNYITSQMQEDWFKSIDNISSFYFIIYHYSKPIGLANIKNIDYNLSKGETGIFIADKEYLLNDSSAFATVMSSFFYFKILKIKTLTGKVLTANKAAISFNLSNGFKIILKNKTYVEMELHDTYKKYQDMAALKNKLCDIYKVSYDEEIKVYISDNDFKEDKNTEWVYNTYFKNNFPFFKLNIENNIPFL